MDETDQDGVGDKASDEPNESMNDSETGSENAKNLNEGETVLIREQYDTLPEKIDDEKIASSVQSLLSEAEKLEDEVKHGKSQLDSLSSQLEQERSEFKSYRTRMDQRQEKSRERAVKGLLEELIDVRTNLLRAIATDHDDIEGIRDGVRITLQQFDDVLASEDVLEISPEPGEAIDPDRHEIIRRVNSERAENTVIELHEPGYEYGEELLRPAKVTVSSPR